MKAYEGKTIFVDGLFINKRNEKTPEWIKLSISFKVKDFTSFAKKYENEAGYINVDLKKSKDGKLYFSLNDYKPKSDKDKRDEEFMDKLGL